MEIVRILIFFLLIPILGYSVSLVDRSHSSVNVSYVDDSNLFINDLRLKRVITEFIKDASDRGLDEKLVTRYLKKLDHIYLSSNLDVNKLGMISIGDTSYILININKIESYSDIKIVLYHELGHWFGLNHNSGGKIMESIRPNIDFNEWDQYVNDLMFGINRLIIDNKTIKPYRE
jgi:hypothetical protein